MSLMARLCARLYQWVPGRTVPASPRCTSGWSKWTRVVLLSLLPPPTTSTIGVLQDELYFPDGPSPEVTFAATYSVGTQKQTTDSDALYTTINPNWYLLHYQLGTGNSAFVYIIHNDWGQDFDPTVDGFVNNPPTGLGGVTSNEDWFEHSDGSLDPTTTGNRLVSNGLYLMNIDNPGWREYELTTIVENMLANGSQAVFADSFNGPVVGFFANQGDARYTGTGPAEPTLWPNGDTWLMKAADYMSFIQGQLTAVGEALNGPGGGFPYLPNVGSMNTEWANIDYSACKGAFAEGFTDFYGMITDYDWYYSMNRALTFTTTSDPNNADRMFIMQPVLASSAPDSAAGLQERSWVFGSYLLVKGDHTYINMYGAPVATRFQWYPEYQVNLGAPQDPGGMPFTVDGYYDPNSQLYIRYYENGLVLVNNSNGSLTYNPAQTMQQLIVSGWGGGVRDGDIDPKTLSYVGGSLSSQLVDTVTVGPYSSVILINQNAPIQMPPPPGN
jgi:hypothetical protein